MSVIPSISRDSAPLWDGYKDGEIRLPWCLDCGHTHLPPAPVCPHCLSESLEWRRASGKGKVSTWVVMQRKYFVDFDPPYLVIQVELDEGPRLAAGMSMKFRDRVRVGMPVVATFETSANGMVLPFFVPAEPV
jgi:uncharacterized OB-fold protein